MDTNALMLCINILTNVFQVVLRVSRAELRKGLSPGWRGTLAPRAEFPSVSISLLSMDSAGPCTTRWCENKVTCVFLLRVKWLITHESLKLEGPKVPAASYILETRKPKMLNTLSRVLIILAFGTQTGDFRLQIRGSLKKMSGSSFYPLFSPFLSKNMSLNLILF